MDKKRKDEFKNYEMEKEHLRKKNLSHLNTDEKKVELDKEEMLKKKHKDHPKLHHPVRGEEGGGRREGEGRGGGR